MHLWMLEWFIINWNKLHAIVTNVEMSMGDFMNWVPIGCVGCISTIECQWIYKIQLKTCIKCISNTHKHTFKRKKTKTDLCLNSNALTINTSTFFNGIIYWHQKMIKYRFKSVGGCRALVHWTVTCCNFSLHSKPYVLRVKIDRHTTNNPHTHWLAKGVLLFLNSENKK